MQSRINYQCEHEGEFRCLKPLCNDSIHCAVLLWCREIEGFGAVVSVTDELNPENAKIAKPQSHNRNKLRKRT